MSPKISMAVRIIFALFILLFGLNKFFHFIPIPAITGDGGELMRIYSESGFMKIIGALQIISAISLLANKFVPLSLTILVAIMFNALLFHILHDPAGLGGSAVGLILGLICIYYNKARFSSLLSA